MIQKIVLLITMLFTLLSCSKPIQKEEDNPSPQYNKWQTQVEKP